MEWKTHLSPSPSPRKRNVFPRGSWLVVTLKRQLAVEVLPRETNLSPKWNQLVTVKSQETGVPKKKRTCSSKEEPLSSGPEESVASQSGEPKKKKQLQKLFQENQNGQVPSGCSLQRCFLTHILQRCLLSHFSHIRLFAIPWTTACQPPLSMGFSRQEYWHGLPCLPPGGSNPCLLQLLHCKHFLYH